MTLNVKDFVNGLFSNVAAVSASQMGAMDTLYDSGRLPYDVVVLDACPETNTVLMDVSFLVLNSKDQKHCGLQTNLQVRDVKGEFWGETFFCPFLLLFQVEKNGPGVF